MPAKSQKQQKFFGIVHGIQKGTVKPSTVSKKAQDVAKSIPKKAATAYASTKTKGLPTKKAIKESYDNAVGNVHAVVKAFPGCTPEMLVKEMDPVMGAKHHGIDHETIHGVYPTHDKAMKIAEKVHKEHLGTMKKLDEKKGTVAGKLTKKIEQLEKEKAAHFKSKDYDKHDEVAAQIKNFMDKLKKIEKSKKEKED